MEKFLGRHSDIAYALLRFVSGALLTCHGAQKILGLLGGPKADQPLLLVAGEHGSLVEYESLGGDAMLAVPTPEHYLPLLYVAGARAAGEPASFPVDGIDGGSVSMLSVRLG